MRALFALSALCACGGGGSGPGSVMGSIKGEPLKIVDAISWSFMYTDTTSGVTSTQAQVFLSTTPDLCADFENNTFTKDVKLLSVGLADVANQMVSAPKAPAKYSVVQPNTQSLPPKTALVTEIGLDDACMPATNATATTGTVTLKTVSENVFSGSFDIKLDSGDHITGNFSPDACPSIQNYLDSTTTPTCT
jgi:hypothetical protein